MMMKSRVLFGMCGVLALAACEPVPGPGYGGGYGGVDPNARAKSGAVIGALSGAVLGAAIADDNQTQGALIGAGVGALAGAVIGNDLDKQAAELRQSLNSNVGVTRVGDTLVVNMPQDLLFAVDSASLRPDLANDIRTVANSLNRYPNTQIQVVGHTDNTGSAAYNQDLSQRRAASVAAVLQSSGVSGARITTIGRGEDAPIATNLTPEGQAQNRRVEIIIRPNR